MHTCCGWGKNPRRLLQKITHFFNCKPGKIDHDEFKDKNVLERPPKLEILISPIPGFSITANSKKMSLGYCNNNWQPEVVAKTGNTYVSETVMNSIEIPTANCGLLTDPA